MTSKKKLTEPQENDRMCLGLRKIKWVFLKVFLALQTHALSSCLSRVSAFMSFVFKLSLWVRVHIPFSLSIPLFAFYFLHEFQGLILSLLFYQSVYLFVSISRWSVSVSLWVLLLLLVCISLSFPLSLSHSVISFSLSLVDISSSTFPNTLSLYYILCHHLSSAILQSISISTSSASHYFSVNFYKTIYSFPSWHYLLSSPKDGSWGLAVGWPVLSLSSGLLSVHCLVQLVSGGSLEG